MGKPKGSPKTGGRAKGTPNKVASPIKACISNLLTKYTNSEDFQNDFESLEPRDRLAICERLLQYVTPRLQTITAKDLFDAEYERLEELLNSCPDSVLDEIVSRMERLKNGKSG